METRFGLWCRGTIEPVTSPSCLKCPAISEIGTATDFSGWDSPNRAVYSLPREGRTEFVGADKSHPAVEGSREGVCNAESPRDLSVPCIGFHGLLGAMRTCSLLKLILVFVLQAGYASAGEEFESLFDGATLEGWVGVQGKAADNWVAKDGVLSCTGEKGAEWIATAEVFDDFDLELEFNVPKNGNSGVFIRAPKDKEAWITGMEIQLLDDSGEKWKGLGPAQFTGAIYEAVAPSKRATKPAGEWQTLRVLCEGRKCKVWVNGEQVIDADLRKLKDKYKKVPGLKRTSGHIGFQNHGGPGLVPKHPAEKPGTPWPMRVRRSTRRWAMSPWRCTFLNRPATARPTGVQRLCSFSEAGGMVARRRNSPLTAAISPLAGMVGMVADYRVSSRHKTTPFDCVKDAKSAVRWARRNAERLGIDPDRLAVGGGSAGGHLAAATATVDGLNEERRSH